MSWSRLQACEASAGSNTTPAAATFTTANLSSGSTLIAVTSTDHGGTGTVTGVADGASNSFVKIVDIAHGGSNNGTTTLWALNTPAGDVGTKPTISASVGSACFKTIVVQEISGIVTSATSAGFTDGTAGTTGSTTSGSGSVGPPTYASAASNEYLLYTWGDDGDNVTATAPAGYTLDTSKLTPTGAAGVAIAYKNSTGGTETGQWSLNGADEYSLILVAFQLAGGGATSGTASAAAAGAVTAVVTQIAPAGAAGAGAVTAVATVIAPAAAAGAAAVADVVMQIAPAAAAGAAAVTTAVTQAAGATAAGAGSVTALATQIAPATAAAAGAVTAAGSAGGSSTATAAGAGAATAVATQIAKATATGAGSVTAAGQITGAASAAAAGAATAKAAQIAPAAAVGAGILTALAAQQATAVITGAASVTAAGGLQVAFTVGTLTASDAPLATLTASDTRG